MTVDGSGVWERQSRWYTRNITSENAARYLDDSGHDFVAEFFAHHGSGDQWTLAEIYNHIAAEHPLDARVPRLFPLTDPSAPARLLYTQAIEIPSHNAQFVVHAWDPRDNRGPIAIGYPVRDCPNAMTGDAADALLGALPWASAAVVPSGMDASAPFTETGTQPGIWVADGRVSRTHDQVGVTTEHYGWADLAHLLRTDLPWWPTSLRDQDAMLAWRPGDAVQTVTPGTTDLDPTAFSAILTAQTSSTVHAIITKAARIVERVAEDKHLNGQGSDDYEPFPGLRHAARSSRYDRHPYTPREDLYTGELTLLMHQRVADHHAGARIARLLGSTHVISGYHRIDSSLHSHRLAQPLLDRLIPASSSDELGFRYLDYYLTGPEQPEYLAHPYWPDCWIVRQGAITHLTVGTSVPATGDARLIHLRKDYAFFRDTTGAVWPVPHPVNSTDRAVDLAAVVMMLIMDGGGPAMLAADWGYTPPQDMVETIRSGRTFNYICDPDRR